MALAPSWEPGIGCQRLAAAMASATSVGVPVLSFDTNWSTPAWAAWIEAWKPWVEPALPMACSE